MKKIYARRYDVAALVVIVLAAALHILITYLGWPTTNSDEATMGLMARHIAYQGKQVFIFYGQDYMGTIEAYLGALFFHLFGPSVFSLRLGVILLFVLFLITMYYLTSLLYNKKLALLTLFLLSIGPSEILFRHLHASGGPMEVLLFGALIVLLSSWLVLTARSQLTPSQRRRRLIVYGLWGLTAGLALWSDPLVVPFVLVPGLLVLILCWREWRTLAIPLVVIGLLIGYSPMFLYKLTVPPEQVSTQLFNAKPAKSGPIIYYDDFGNVIPKPNFLQQIEGTFLVSIPVATGANAFCTLTPREAWPLKSQISSYTALCTGVHTLWSLCLLALWGLAVWLAIRFLRLHKSSTDPVSPVQGQDVALYASRLALLGSAGLTVLTYMFFPAPGSVPWSSSRYLVGLLIALPAVFSVLWDLQAFVKLPSLRWRMGFATARYTLLLALSLILLSGTVSTVGMGQNAHARTIEEYALIQNLEQAGIQHIYSDYWTCNRLIFESQEQIICSVIDDDLQPGLDRYLLYRSIVKNDPQASYALVERSKVAENFAAHIAATPDAYQSYHFNGYVIYRPVSVNKN